jgi:hypothetical protein
VRLGILKPDRLIGVHVLQIFAFPSAIPTRWHRMRLREAGDGVLANFDAVSGYITIHQTRPQTLAYGLTDSPSGQLAWNRELFMGGSAARTSTTPIAIGSTRT